MCGAEDDRATQWPPHPNPLPTTGEGIEEEGNWRSRTWLE